jgi:hypothetical protein
MKITVPLAALAAFTMTLGPPGAQATVITGQLSITGSAIVDEDTIDWTPPATGTGTFNIDPFVGNTGYFASLAGTSGSILDLELAVAPVGVPINIPNFMTFAADPSLTFTLTMIPFGPFSPAQCFAAPAAGQTRTVPGSPFGLSNTTAASTDVNLVLYGTVSDGSGSPASAFKGTFTTQFDVPYQQLLTDIFVNHGSARNTYSATFVVTAVPESATIFLFGAGLLGIAVIARKRTT